MPSIRVRLPNMRLPNPQSCLGLAIIRPRLLSTAPALPYHVLRNTRGSLPVYSDLKNAGSRYQVQVRNIQGDANVFAFFPHSFAPHSLSEAQALLRDLRATLFPPDSDEASILRGQVVRSKHIVLQGPGRGWKGNVEDWLRTRGF